LEKRAIYVAHEQVGKLTEHARQTARVFSGRRRMRASTWLV
jgi:hypothetical protein